MSQDMKDQVVVIAGGASGMGLELAKMSVARGAVVHVLGRNAEKLSAVDKEFQSRVGVHAVDIGNEQDIVHFASLSSLQRVDHLVTTAADLTFGPFLELKDADIEKMLRSKFWGPVYLVRNLAPKMTRGGSITFFSGSAAYKAWAGASIVANLNAGLEGLARTLALELAPIRVNVVSPGVVDSDTWSFLAPVEREATLRAIGDGLPAKRVGTVAELANAALYFMNNGFATGTTLQVDGGANA